MNNNEIFEDFWKTYVWPEAKQLFYRLYYNENGEPISYSMEDLPGKYIEISVQQFAASDPHVRVKDGRLIKQTTSSTTKLVPATDGTPCAVDNITLVVDTTSPNQKWKLRHYDNN